MIEHIQIVGEIFVVGIGIDADAAEDREPLQFQADEVDEQQPYPERRNRLDEYQDRRNEAIDERAATPGGGDAQQRAQPGADEQGDAKQTERPGIAAPQHAGHVAG